jgi:hypothetical protein
MDELDDPGGPKRRLIITGAVLLLAMSIVAGAVWARWGSAGPRSTFPAAAAVPADPGAADVDPAAGCPVPTVSRATAEQQALEQLQFTGSIEGDPLLVATTLMTGGAYARAHGDDPATAPSGCVWVVEVHAKYVFTDFPPWHSKTPVPTLPPPSWQRILFTVGIDDREGMEMSTWFGGRLCDAPGTPCPTQPPPLDGWPTAAPTEPPAPMPDIAPELWAPRPTPAPPTPGAG